MCARCVVMFYFCVLHALHEDLLDWKIQCPTVGVLCENCVIAQSCVFEVSWGMKNIRDVGVDTSNYPVQSSVA